MPKKMVSFLLIHDFWRENSNYPGKLANENSQKNFVVVKNKFLIFLKIVNFETKSEIFLHCVKTIHYYSDTYLQHND